MALSVLRHNLKIHIFKTSVPTTVKSILLNRFKHTITPTSELSAVLQDTFEILRKAANNEGISKPILAKRKRNEKATGYLGNLVHYTIYDQKSNKKEDVIVKKAHRGKKIRSSIPLKELYSNECAFYDKIWPAFMEFQESIVEGPDFHNIPKCYATNMEENKEAVVLEDLFCSGFESVPKGFFFDKDHFKLLFSNYGKLHGLSFAYKMNNPKNFHEMSTGLYDFWAGLKNVPILANSVRFVLSQCLADLEYESEDGISRKFQDYVHGGVLKFSKSAEYTGEDAVILHGNPWSDKVMFKYNEERKPTDLRIVDFQSTKLGNPIHDLSYCFYSGAPPEEYEKLDYYMEVYHYSLSKTLERFECNPTKIYPLEKMQTEWKNHCKFGFIASLLILMEKSVFKKSESTSILDIITSDDRFDAEGKFDQNEFRERSMELMKHMYTKGFL